MSQASRHSKISQKTSSRRGSVTKEQLKNSRSQIGAGSADQLSQLRPSAQGNVSEKSSHSMTLSQRVQNNNARMMEESNSGMLPNIEEHKQPSTKSRVQSATKRSTSSIQGAQTFGADGKKGPVKAFENLAIQTPSMHSAKHDDLDDKALDNIQIKDQLSNTSKRLSDKNLQRSGTLEPIATDKLKSSQRQRSSRKSLAEQHKQSNSSKKLSNASFNQMAKSETELNQAIQTQDQKFMTADPDAIAAVRASSVLMIPPATAYQPSPQPAPSSDHPVINLDLHQVASHEDVNAQGITSAPDLEASVVQASPFKSNVSPSFGAKQDLMSPRSHGRNGSHMDGSKSSHSQVLSQKKRVKRVNQFKQNKMSHEEIISFLFDLSSASVGLNRKLEPTDLDSTQSLDSFLAAIIYINEQNVQKKDQKLVDNLHLSTGTRTNFCLEVLNFIIKQQAKETIFIDAVEFFQESLEHMVEVENENVENKKLVEGLQQSKTELTIMRFDLQNKLQQTSNELLKLRQKEYEQSLNFAESRQHLQAKQAECESLHYRLKHLGFGATDSADGPVQSIAKSTEDNITGEGQMASSNHSQQHPAEGAERAEESKKDKISDKAISQKSQSQQDSALGNAAKDIQEDLEDKIEQFRNQKLQNTIDEDASNPGAQGGVGNVQRLQDMLNQIQIDNKNITEENISLKLRIDSKDRQVAHLENRVTNNLLEHEETILKLKSEIVLLKNSINCNDSDTTKQLLKMRERVEAENEKANGDKIRSLEDQKDKLIRENGLQSNRIDQLSLDYKNIHNEFKNYRNDKQKQETLRDTYVSEVEQKLATLSKNHLNTKNSLGDKIRTLENTMEQKTKENQVLFLRLRYMRQTADVLLRQKTFLSDTLEKSRLELEMKMNQLESGMLSQNKNKSYLVSIEKAIKQSRNVAEISKSALSNILQIVKFFKVEKIHQLVFQTEEPSDQLEEKISQASQMRGSTQGRISKPYSEDYLSSENDGNGEKGDYHLEKINMWLNELKACLDLPVNFKPRIQESTMGKQSRGASQAKVNKNEEYYLEHCPNEIISSLIKILVEGLIRTKAIQSVEQIPFSISRMLFISSSKADLLLEREIYEQFCFESNKIMVDEINHFNDKVTTFEKIQNLLPTMSINQNQINIGVDNIEESEPASPGRKEFKEPQSAKVDRANRKPLTMMQQSALLLKQKQQSEKGGSSSQHEVISLAQQNSTGGHSKRSEDIFANQALSKRVMKNELELIKITEEEQREQNRMIQQGLAEKIIKLEETIDFIKEDHEEKLSQAEFSYRQELEQIRLGTIQRETQLLHQIDQLQERNADLEIKSEQNNGRNTSQMNRSKSMMRKSSVSMPKASQHENLRQAASVNSLVQVIEIEAQEKIQALEQQFETYKSNVQQFVRIRESTHSTISLVFEASQTNLSMVNDSMLLFYLSRIFRLPKDKIRLLQTYNLFEEKKMLDMQRHSESQTSLRKPDFCPVEMIKVNIEINEDYHLIKHEMIELKMAIRDGSSLLYDLLPSYLSINMGHSGLATANGIKDCHLISKLGRCISGIDFVVNLMRSTINPYCFIVVILNLEKGEEYCLELDEQDILYLTEGDRGLLEDSDPNDLQTLIIDNLDLIERDGIKLLTCTHKVFFNQLWHGIMNSKISYNSQHKQPTNMQKNHEDHVNSDADQTKINPQFGRTTIRDEMLLNNQPYNRLDSKQHFKKLLQVDAGCQTEFEGSVLYDSVVTVFKGHKQLNQEVRIEMEVQQSQHENLVTMVFTEPRSLNKAKFCVFNRLPNFNITSMANTENTEDLQINLESSQGKVDFEKGIIASGHGQQLKSQYIIHSEVIVVGKEHLVLVCVERIQNDGFLVKMHDLKLITSDEFYLIRKSNGHFTRFNLSQNLQLMYQEDFRNLIFDLAFAQQTQSEDLMLQNLTYASEKLQSLGKSPQLVSQELFASAEGSSTNKKSVRRLKSFQVEAHVRLTKNSEILKQNSDWRSLQEKGILLFRDVKFVRTNFEKVPANNSNKRSNTMNATRADAEDEVQESLISLYLKEEQVNIEVFLYNDEQKMSINTNVQALKLFGRDPSDIPFSERITLLDSMLEKLFVLQQDGRFHMKVEHQAESINTFMSKQKERISALEEIGGKSTSALKRRQFADQAYEEKIREIQMDKTTYVKNGKARLFQRYITQHSLSFTINIYVMVKQKKQAIKQSTKRLNTVGKTQQQIEQQKIEKFLDENGDFDQVYIETTSPVNDDQIYLLLDKKKLAKILTMDATCEWHSLLTMWSHDLIEYFFRNIEIDLNTKTINIYNSEDITDLLVYQCRAVNGGQLLFKENNLIIDGFGTESSKLLRKTLVLNEEVDFTEISYDIKLFKISRQSPFGSGNLTIGSETLSYHIEIFNVNQPDVIYKHRIPVQQTDTHNVHDPVTFVIDVFNLIDNSLIDELTNTKSRDKKHIESQEKSEKKGQQAKESAKSLNMSKASNKQGRGSKMSQKELEEKAEKKKQEEAEDKATREAERVQMENMMQEHSTKYQLLFKKYIDNQLIIVIQENKFPATISCTLVEPSSRLIWKTSYEPSTEIVSPSSFSVVDQGTFETFMTLVYDSVVPMSIITSGSESIKQKGDWYNIPIKDSKMVKEKISEQLQITIKKDIGKLHINLQNPQFVTAEDDMNSSQNLQSDQNSNEGIVLDKKKSGLNLVIQKNRGVYMNAKILNFDDSNLEGTVNNSYVFLVKVCVHYFTVSILDLQTQTSVFHFKFRHSNPIESDVHITPITQVNPIHKLEDIKQHVVDAIKNLNSEHLQEQIESNHIRIQQEKTMRKAGIEQEDQDSRITTFESVLFKVQECPAHQQRFNQRKMNTIKVVTLHRKIYYDETMQKLIIITANIKYRQGLQRLDNPMLLNEEINEVDFRILEPEHNTLTCLTVPLTHCFNERQLVALNKRDMLRLKSLVRIVLEERSDIRRKEMDQDEQNQAYTLYIVPQPEEQFIDEAQIQDEIQMQANQSLLNSGQMSSEEQQQQHQQYSYQQQDQQQHSQELHQQRSGSDGMQMMQMMGNNEGMQNGQPMDDLIDINEDMQGIIGSADIDQNQVNDEQDYNNHQYSGSQEQMMIDQQQDMQMNSSSGQINGNGQNQRVQSNSIIIEEASQEDKEQEMDSEKIPGGSIYQDKSQSSFQEDGISGQPARASHQSQQALSPSDLTGQKSNEKQLNQHSSSAQQL